MARIFKEKKLNNCQSITCLIGIERPDPTEDSPVPPLPSLTPAAPPGAALPSSPTFFLEGVKRFDLLLLFLEVVGVEEGVAKSLLFSLFSTEKSLAVEAGIANLTASEFELPVELMVPVLLEPGGGTVGGATMTPRPFEEELGGMGVTNSSCWWYIGV